MTRNLRIFMLIFAIFIALISCYSIRKKTIPVKYTLVWLISGIIIGILAIFPKIFFKFSTILGFNMMSNMVIAIFISILLLITMALTVISSGLKKKQILLIQEISILKKRMDEYEAKINE